MKNREAWSAAVYGAAMSQTQISDWTRVEVHVKQDNFGKDPSSTPAPHPEIYSDKSLSSSPRLLLVMF